MHRLLPLLALSLSVFLLLSLNACTTVPPAPGGVTPTPASTALQTFDAIYVSAVTADDLVIKATSTALSGGLISVVQAKRVLAIADQVKTALDTANAAAQLGNTAMATGNLATALGPIAILSACLTTRPLTITTFEACTAKLTPPVPA